MFCLAAIEIDSSSDDDQGFRQRKIAEIKTIPARGKASPYWKGFEVPDPRAHPEMKNVAVCKLPTEDGGTCGQLIKISNGTGGLKRHHQHMHPDVYESIQSKKAEGSKLRSIRDMFPVKKSKTKSKKEIKNDLTQAIASFLISRGSQPLSTVEDPAFRQMFYPLHEDAADLMKINRGTVRQMIIDISTIALTATEEEIRKHILSLTMDHWTSPKDDNYSAVTGHYIEKWKLRSLLIDFKVWHGSTAGSLLADDLIRVCKKYSIHAKVLQCTTDTTGNMITLGRSLQKQGVQHDFCVDHNFHLVARLAFDGKFT